MAYPENSKAKGIGPILGEDIAVSELYSDHSIEINSPRGDYKLLCESDGIEITKAGT